MKERVLSWLVPVRPYKFLNQTKVYHLGISGQVVEEEERKGKKQGTYLGASRLGENGERRRAAEY